MKDYLDVLYEYVQETGLTHYLETWEYRRSSYDLEENWEAFRSGLTAEQVNHLDALLAQEWKVEHLEEQAVFRSGISIGLTLGRL